MQITIPKEVELVVRERAKASGFATVDDYVLNLLRVGDQSQSSQALPYEQWRRELDAFVGSLTPGNPNVDDSRDSIYPGR